MANTNTTKRSKSGVRLLLLALLTLVGCLWLLQSYRVSVIKSGFNQWAGQYDLEIVSLDEITFSGDGLLINNALLRHNKSQLTLSKMIVKFASLWQPSAIKIDNIGLTVEYQSLAAITDKSSYGAGLSNIDDLIESLSLPKINLSQLDIELVNFPQSVVPAALKQLRVTDLRFGNDNMPSLSMALSIKGQPLFDFVASYKEKGLHGRIEMALADSQPVIEAILPQSIPVVELAGQLYIDFIMSLSGNPDIDLKLAIDNLAIARNEVKLIHSTDIRAHSTLTTSPVRSDPASAGLSPVVVSVVQHSALGVNKLYCQQIYQLLNKASDNCDLLSDTDYGSLLLSSPLELEVMLESGSVANWQITTPRAAFKIETDREKLSLVFDNALLSADKFSGNWLFGGTSNRIPFAKQLEFSLQGQLAKNHDIVAEVAHANFTLQQFKQQGIAIKQIQISARQPVEILITDGGIADIESSWSTSFSEIDYRGLVIGNINAEHLSRLSASRLKLQSNWQAGELQLTSVDTIVLNNYQIRALSGEWQLPEQAMAPLLAIKNPLPADLLISPLIRTHINYQGKFSDDKLQLTAKINGRLIADTASYNDITMSDLQARWQCQIQYNQAQADTLKPRCDINSELAQLDIGFPVTKLTVRAGISKHQQNIRLKLSEAGGKFLGGSFSLRPLLITDFDNINAQFDLSDVSLSKIVELQQQQGIRVTGLLHGTLPVHYHNNQFTVTDGYIENQPPGGVIQIRDNETVNQLRLSQPQLVFVLDALEDLRYSNLTSSVNYQADGQAQLKVSIKGRNPDIERPIEFNYSHQENVLQLMRSLLIADEISKQIEKIAD